MSEGAGAPILIHRVIARLNVGGPAMHVVHLARAMDDERWATRLIAGAVPDAEGNMEYYAEERGVALTRLPSMSREISALGDLRALWALYRLFRRDRPAVVHTHTAKAGLLGRVAALLAGVPVRIHTYHGHVLGGSYFAPWKTRLFLGLERLLARATTRLVVLTRRQAREMSDELRVAPPERFRVIPLGLELDRFRAVEREATGARVRASLGIPDDARVVGIVGRLVSVKNHELFLEAMATVIGRSQGNVRALVVGAGEREDALRAHARGLGIGDDVLWLGWRRDLPELYAAMDVVALTSHDEGTPVALLEAVAAGARVVARDVGGVREVLEGAGEGAVVEREAGAEGWARALIASMDESAPSEAARDRTVAHHSVERLVEELAALYRAEGAGR